MRSILIPAALVLLATISLNAASAPAPATPRAPNIVIVLADDLGYGDTGAYGGTGVRTPNFDRLASRGLRFTQAYAPSSTCTPSRYAMLTGEYAWRQPPQQTAILDGDAPLAIKPGTETLPALLKRAGYTTALVGKWHLGLGDGKKAVDFNGVIKPGPLEVGFDRAFFLPATLDRVPCVYIANDRVVGVDPKDPIRVSYLKPVDGSPTGLDHPEMLKYPADRQHSGTIINGISRIGYMAGGKAAQWVDEDIADVLTRHAVEFITANRDRPFFLYFGAHEPHVARAPHPRFRGVSQMGVRGDSIAEFDWELGQIVDALEANHLTENTLIIVSSDNGPVLFDGYYDGSDKDVGQHQPAGGLRGWKYSRWEGGTRVPFVAAWPGHVPAGTTDQFLSLVDLPATCGALTRQAPPANWSDSINLLPLLLGQNKNSPRTNIVEHGIGNVLALRTADWKYIPANADSATGIGSGADPKDARFSDCIVPQPLLINLRKDPAERGNEAAAHPEIVRDLAARLEAIRAGREH